MLKVVGIAEVVSAAATAEQLEAGFGLRLVKPKPTDRSGCANPFWYSQAQGLGSVGCSVQDAELPKGASSSRAGTFVSAESAPSNVSN